MGRGKSNKKGRTSRKRRAGPGSHSRGHAGPKVHVQVAVASSRLDEVAALVKPAILYADKVTIYSPAASLVGSIRKFGQITDPRQRVVLMLDVADGVPSLAEHIGVDLKTFRKLREFLALDPKAVRRLTGMLGRSREVEALYEQIDVLGPIWEEKFPAAIREAEENLGGGDLMAAVDDGAVALADFSEARPDQVVADAVNATLGQRQSDDMVNALIVGFTSQMLEILSNHRSFPLLDAHASGLIRSLEIEAGFCPAQPAVRHGAEITSVTGIMGFLPSFPDLPMDEILDLRQQLMGPLRRFRSTWSLVSREFDSRPFDADFNAEIEDAWRTRVEPALLEIRDALSEHGLLREAASIALGDPRRILIEAGGVLAAAHADASALSGMMAAALAAVVPVTDVTLRAMRSTAAARRQVRKHPFYFLHRLQDEAVRRAS